MDIPSSSILEEVFDEIAVSGALYLSVAQLRVSLTKYLSAGKYCISEDCIYSSQSKVSLSKALLPNNVLKNDSFQ